MKLTDTIVLITGANGWLGRRLARSLTVGHVELGTVGAGGARVRALAMPGEDTSMLSSLGVEVVFGDVRDANSVRNFMQAAEGATLLHLAGVIHPAHGTKEFMEVNFTGSVNVISAAGEAGVKRAVVMSSNSPVGASRNPAELSTRTRATVPIWATAAPNSAWRNGSRGESTRAWALRSPSFARPGFTVPGSREGRRASSQ